jgi:hypothetical protein
MALPGLLSNAYLLTALQKAEQLRPRKKPSPEPASVLLPETADIGTFIWELSAIPDFGTGLNEVCKGLLPRNIFVR